MRSASLFMRKLTVLLALDPSWTKDETDYLFALCKKYDLRFVVIVDRYEYPGTTRSMEVCAWILLCYGEESVKVMSHNRT
jgi:hypothetical protein